MDKRNVETQDNGIKTEYDQLGNLRWEYTLLSQGNLLSFV